MKVIKESPLEKELYKQFDAVVLEGYTLLGIANSSKASIVISALNDFVSKESQDGLEDDFDVWVERALPLGSLWGELFVKELDWEWINVYFEDNSQAIGVVDKNRALGVYPWYFILGCIDNGAMVTIELAWNMLLESDKIERKINSYTNLMDGVHYIVPPI